jgi:hypothetical protein
VNPNLSDPRQPLERRRPRPHVPPQGCRPQRRLTCHALPRICPQAEAWQRMQDLIQFNAGAGKMAFADQKVPEARPSARSRTSLPCRSTSQATTLRRASRSNARAPQRRSSARRVYGGRLATPAPSPSCASVIRRAAPRCSEPSAAFRRISRTEAGHPGRVLIVRFQRFRHGPSSR